VAVGWRAGVVGEAVAVGKVVNVGRGVWVGIGVEVRVAVLVDDAVADGVTVGVAVAVEVKITQVKVTGSLNVESEERSTISRRYQYGVFGKALASLYE
jgi:hypothetical protein